MQYIRKTSLMSWKPIFISLAVLLVLFIITNIILINYDLKNLKPHISNLVESATGRELIIGGNIHLQVGLAPRLIIRDVALKNAQWGSSQNMIQAKRIKLQVALLPLLFKKIIVKQLVISEPDILLEVGQHGKTNFAFKKQSIPVERKKKENRNLPVFGSKKIIIKNGRFTYNNLKNKKTYIATIKRLTLRGKDIAEPVNLEFHGLYNEQTVFAEGTIGPLPALSDPDQKFMLNILIKTGENSVFLDGSSQDIASINGSTLDFTSMINNPSIIEKLTKQPFPIKEPFKISGKFIASDPDIYQIPKFTFTSNNIDIEGAVELNIKEARPKIKALITAKKLNLKSLQSDSPKTKRKKISAKTKKKKSRVFSSAALPATDFKTVDADVRLQAASVLLPGLMFQTLSANISLKEGRLQIDDFKAAMGTGTLDGYFHLYAANNMWNAETAMKVEQLPLELLVPSKKVTDSLDGDIDIVFFLAGKGKSIAQIMANLNGDFGLSMCNGLITTKYINLLGAEFSTNLVKRINPFKEKTDRTEINCLVCILDINNGIAQTEALVLDTGRTLTFGNGHVDLNSEKLNISLKPIPKEGLGIDKVGKINISLGELYKPVKISGTLARPSLAMDFTQTAITLTKVAGGVALLGPAGVLLALVTGRIGDDNPCLAAVEAVKEGSKEKGLKYKKKEGVLKRTTTSITGRLKKLFGRFFKKPDEKSLA